jgi:hypothetical protein
MRTTLQMVVGCTLHSYKKWQFHTCGWSTKRQAFSAAFRQGGHCWARQVAALIGVALDGLFDLV